MALWGKFDDKTSTGTVAIAANGLVTGTSTVFDNEAQVGDYIRVSDEDYLIVSITSNTQAQVIAGTVGATLSAVSPAAAYALSEKPKYVTTAEGKSATHGIPEIVYGASNAEVGVAQGGIATITIGDAGTGYDSTANDALVITGGGGSGATATFANDASGNIVSVSITAFGSGFTSVPTVTVNTTGTNGNTAVANSAVLTATISGAAGAGIAHAGWVRRIEGTGGRAGRVQYETLVASSSIAGDAEDDSELPDS